jgi:hypothetical protein
MQSSPVASTISEPLLLKQYKLLGAIIDAPWATRLDHKISRHVIDRYYAKFGNARVALRYLEKATGAKRTNIIASLRRITKNGVIKIIRQGIGTRPTEYDLNFDFAVKRPSGPVDGTSTSGLVDGTPTGLVDGTSKAASGPSDGTESYLRNMSTDMLTVSRNECTPAVPTAPPVCGLEAATAATAVDPKAEPVRFEELWAAFPRKHQRAKARAAYDKLAPNEALHADLVAAATALAAHHEKNGTERKWWKHMHTWLDQECYLEDLPQPYENPKEAAIARAKQNGPRKANKAISTTKVTGLSPKTPIGRHTVKIVASELLGVAFDAERLMRFSYRIEDTENEGKEFSHSFKIASADEAAQTEGRSIFADLRRVTGIDQPEDTCDLHGIALRAIVGPMGHIRYEALL